MVRHPGVLELALSVGLVFYTVRMLAHGNPLGQIGSDPISYDVLPFSLVFFSFPFISHVFVVLYTDAFTSVTLFANPHK